jgi:hypothetical protein
LLDSSATHYSARGASKICTRMDAPVLRLCIVAVFLAAGTNLASAENIFCLPGAGRDWNGIHWELGGFSGDLSEVTVSPSMFLSGTTTITCKRGSVTAYAFVKGKCRFAPGTVVTHRTQLKGKADVCHLDKMMNDAECVVECND